MEVNHDSLPPKLAKSRTRLRCELEGPRDVSTTLAAGTYFSMGYDDSFDLQSFKQRLKIKMISHEEDKLVFSMTNVDVSIANALRRIMIAEVPTMALETIHIYQNTGVIQDEVLAHRLGLIPFRINPDNYEYRREVDSFTSENSVCFKLHVKCTEADLKELKSNSKPVYASDMVFFAQPSAEGSSQMTDDTEIPRPVNKDVLITRLRPGQEIELAGYCEKGVGQTHAKWSPVCPVTYRLRPAFEFPEGPFEGDDANELVKLCPMNVFELLMDPETETSSAIAAMPENCTTCRACLERFPGRVKLYKKKFDFIFTINSSGSIPPTQIFKTAVSILKGKATELKNNLEANVRAAS
eukprot:Selendium_serpulae@DN2743_c0_g1_i3.p1